VLTEGYSSFSFRKDVFAALTVAVVALPLSMAIAVASFGRYKWAVAEPSGIEAADPGHGCVSSPTSSSRRFVRFGVNREH
jgi:hypothetical protein